MEERSIYKDIENRTGGNIYIGVVGPVRTGKSTFIKRFCRVSRMRICGNARSTNCRRAPPVGRS